jgi:ubiquinol-cytochrome c reductase cytochrome c1 subunit
MLALAVLLLIAPPTAWSAGGGGDLMDPHVDVTDTASLQRGAMLFANYCMGCHSMKYLRYSRLAQDLDIPEEVVERYLIWSEETQVHDTMGNAMSAQDGEQWFGVAPPDLSLTVRARGADWVYTYLNTFYLDESQPTGVNNMVLEGASMPHVLWRLQGIPVPVVENGEVVGVEVPEGSGTLSEEEYHEVTRDIVNFMAYAAEPIRAYRESLGVWVILFLLGFTGLAYLLKREYWKDVH